MKKLYPFSLQYLGKLSFCIFLLIVLSCKEPIDRDVSLDDQGWQGVEQWQDILDGLLLDKSIIVQHGNSIQEAIEAASPDDAIYIEPEIYTETITIDKNDIKLIGLDDNLGGKVILENPGREEKGIIISGEATGISIHNIKLQNFINNDIPASDGSTINEARKAHYFKMTRDLISGNIAYYQFEVHIGNRPFDVIRIRRLICENRPYHPLPAKGEVFYGAWRLSEFRYILSGWHRRSKSTKLSCCFSGIQRDRRMGY